MKEDKQKPNNYFDKFKVNNEEKQVQEDFIQKREPEQTEREKQILHDYYEQHRNDVVEQVQKDLKKIDKQDIQDFKDDRAIYDVFKDLIDPNNKRFKKFIDQEKK